ncbi:hypothetical protein HRG84_19180 [Flavisolibacter sp. BT320]|nr:hypothetical protein [Flavisolibacter longurius]
MSKTSVLPLFKPEIDFAIAPEIFQEKATIVHCRMTFGGPARIWPSTFLVQEDGTRKALLQAYGIAPYPDWKYLKKDSVFTLVFEELDAPCRLFELLEDIPESGEFHLTDIRRNKEDVYQISI